MWLLEWSDYFCGSCTNQILLRLGPQKLKAWDLDQLVPPATTQKHNNSNKSVSIKTQFFSPNYKNVIGKPAKCCSSSSLWISREKLQWSGDIHKLSYIATPVLLQGTQRSQKIYSHSLGFSTQNYPRPPPTEGLKVEMWSTPGSLQPVAILLYWEILKAHALKVCQLTHNPKKGLNSPYFELCIRRREWEWVPGGRKPFPVWHEKK